MDKLDLEGRVASLERRLSLGSNMVMMLGGVALICTLLYLVRGVDTATEIRPATPMPRPVMDTIKTPAEIHDPSMNRIADLESDLTKLHDLQTNGLINSVDFAAKKALIMAKPLIVGDFAQDLQLAKKLSDAAIITSQEYEQLKKKILQLGS